MGSQEELPVRAKPSQSRKPFGNGWKENFRLDSEWLNLNHGSFGTYPTCIRDKLRAYQDAAEARPDDFIRYRQPQLLDEAREAAAALVKATVDTIVFVGNATEGINTVLRNLSWAPDGNDVVLTFSTAYESCAKAVDFLVEYYEGRLGHHVIDMAYPLEDEDVLDAFRRAVEQTRQAGKRARAVIFDVVSSRPGVLFPWIEMVRACKELGVTSVVDGAQGIGMVPLDLPGADPDFFVSNCHKWLHVPRGCAVLYTPLRNQHVLRTSLATSHGFEPKLVSRTSPLPPSNKTAYAKTFEFVGTRDCGPYLCVKDAIAWRRDVCGGEASIVDYLVHLNRSGIRLVADALGTEYLDNAKGTLTHCAMGNVALPIVVGDDDGGNGTKALQWIAETLVGEYKTFMVVFVMSGRLWVRISAQIYLDLKDYERAAVILKALCARIARGDYIGKKTKEKR